LKDPNPENGTEQVVPVHSSDEARVLLGPLDSNARLIRQLFGVNVLARDGSLRLLGGDAGVDAVRAVFDWGLEGMRAGRGVATADVARRLREANGGNGGVEVPTAPELAMARAAPRRGHVRPRTPGQERYVAALQQHDLVFGVGPAGTGKTFLAVAAAVEALKAGAVRRLVLARPAVEAGEKLGFLPGDFEAKVHPYLQPLYDSLQDLLDPRTYERYLESEVVEVCPIAYMRGRTLNDAFIILDEAQNTTVPQMMMFLTRMGEGSRMVVTGDPSQVDLPRNVRSGLADALVRFRGVDGICISELHRSDVVRHPLVQRILEAYDGAPSA
jgi:phosphate starvation-inducible PhoH-like protein